MQKYIAILLVAILGSFVLASCQKNDELSPDGAITSNDLSYFSEKNSNEFMSTHYISDVLTETEQEIYDELVNGMRNFEPSVPQIYDASLYTRIYNLITIEELDLTYVENRKSSYNEEEKHFEIVYDYAFSPEQVKMMQVDINNKTQEILAGITADMSDYDKLKYIHDYIILGSVYDGATENVNSIHSVLIDGKGNCEGFSKTFSYFCNILGFENIIVTGVTSVPHMWNMVKLGGNWYHIDVTWDQPHISVKNDLPDFILYQYFLVDDSIINNYHVIQNMGRELPKCYSDTENYYKKNGVCVYNEDEFFPIFEKALDEAVETGKSYAMVKFDTNNLLISTKNIILEQALNEGKELNSILDTIEKKHDVEIYIQWSEQYTIYRNILFIIEYAES